MHCDERATSTDIVNALREIKASCGGGPNPGSVYCLSQPGDLNLTPRPTDLSALSYQQRGSNRGAQSPLVEQPSIDHDRNSPVLKEQDIDTLGFHQTEVTTEPSPAGPGIQPTVPEPSISIVSTITGARPHPHLIPTNEEHSPQTNPMKRLWERMKFRRRERPRWR